MLALETNPRILGISMPNVPVPPADLGSPYEATPYLGIIATAVMAIDEHFATEPMPSILAPAMNLARAVAAAQAAGVPVHIDDVEEAAAALAGALRKHRETEADHE
jgi:hypothetical protein